MTAVPVKPSAMPVVALVLGIIGFCFAPFLVLAIVLAAISLARSNDPAYAPRKTLAIVTLVMSVLYIPVMMGILAAIAIPNFIKFQARSKQTECKVNLESAYAAQQLYWAAHNAWGQTADEIDFAPQTKTRYAYRISAQSAVPATIADGLSTEALERGYPMDLVPQLGSVGSCPDCVLTMACAGNIDSDATIDVWSISSAQRTVKGEVIPAGRPFNHVNDVTE